MKKVILSAVAGFAVSFALTAAAPPAAAMPQPQGPTAEPPLPQPCRRDTDCYSYDCGGDSAVCINNWCACR
jgi:hypothetical protein